MTPWAKCSGITSQATGYSARTHHGCLLESSPVHSPSSSLLTYLKQKKMTKFGRPLYPCRRPGRNFWLLALAYWAWLSPSHYIPLGEWMGDFSLFPSFSICNSVFQINFKNTQSHIESQEMPSN